MPTPPLSPLGRFAMPLHKLLLVDASPSCRALICLAFADLENQGAILSVSQADAAQQAETIRPDAILLDGNAQTAQALGAALTQRKTTVRIPVISLADLPSTASASPPALAVQIRALLAEARLVNQLARLEELGGSEFVREMV